MGFDRKVTEEMQTNRDELVACILIVDDDPITRLIMIKMIESTGYEVEVAATVKRALQCIDRREFSLILLDGHLDDGYGWEVAQRVRDKSAGKRVPIVAISSDDSSETIGKLLKSGVDHFMVKPIHLEQFRRLLVFYLTESDS